MPIGGQLPQKPPGGFKTWVSHHVGSKAAGQLKKDTTFQGQPLFESEGRNKALRTESREQVEKFLEKCQASPDDPTLKGELRELVRIATLGSGNSQGRRDLAELINNSDLLAFGNSSPRERDIITNRAEKNTKAASAAAARRDLLGEQNTTEMFLNPLHAGSLVDGDASNGYALFRPAVAPEGNNTYETAVTDTRMTPTAFISKGDAEAALQSPTAQVGEYCVFKDGKDTFVLVNVGNERVATYRNPNGFDSVIGEVLKLGVKESELAKISPAPVYQEAGSSDRASASVVGPDGYLMPVIPSAGEADYVDVRAVNGKYDRQLEWGNNHTGYSTNASSYKDLGPLHRTYGGESDVYDNPALTQNLEYKAVEALFLQGANQGETRTVGAFECKLTSFSRDMSDQATLPVVHWQLSGEGGVSSGNIRKNGDQYEKLMQNRTWERIGGPKELKAFIEDKLSQSSI